MECGEGCQRLIPHKRIRDDESILYLFRSFACSTAWDFPLPFSLLRSFFSSLPLSTLLHFHLRSIPSFLFRKKNCKGQKVWRGVSRDGKQRELHEVGVMCRITMKGWGVGRSERQMDGEKQHIHLIDASNSS